MADDVTLPGTGDVVAADEVAGKKYQRIKLDMGGDGATSPITAANPLPIVGAVTNAGTFAVQSTLAAGTNNIGDVDVLSIVPGTAATNLGKAEDAVHASGDVGVMALAVRRDANTTLATTDGDYGPHQLDAVGNLKVTAMLSAIAPAAGAGASGTGTARVTLPTDQFPAHDAAIGSQNALRTSSRARTSNVTGVANDDVCDEISTVVGARIVKPFSIPETDWSYAAVASGGITNTTAVTIKTAAAAGIRNYLTALSLQNNSAVGTEVLIRDGAAGTTLWRGYLHAAGALAVGFPNPLKSTAATLLEVVCITTGTATYVNAQGYTAP